MSSGRLLLNQQFVHLSHNQWTYLEVKRSKMKVTRPINAVTDSAPYTCRREFPWHKGESESNKTIHRLRHYSFLKLALWGLDPVSLVIKKGRLRWFGHVKPIKVTIFELNFLATDTCCVLALRCVLAMCVHCWTDTVCVEISTRDLQCRADDDDDDVDDSFIHSLKLC